MSRRSKRKQRNSSSNIFIFVLIIIIIILAIILGLKISKNKEVGNNNKVVISNIVNDLTESIISTPEPVKEVQIFKGTDRPIAVMIDNNIDAWPHNSINDAYLVYEIIVEGNETRLMALFKGKDLDSIGPVRSARHYFLDYALENGAIYTHFGWSPQAESDIEKLDVDNINGIFYDSGREKTDSSTFWRTSSKSAPHNALVSTAGILEIANDLGYETESNNESVLNYVVDEVDLKSDIIAEHVSIPYASSNVVEYEYDADPKLYTRYSKGTIQTEAETEEPVTTKNIIITFAENYTLDDSEEKGRQGLYNIGDLDGYYITNGKAIKITCSKSSRTSITKYLDSDGNEINVNDGVTYINICPIDSDVSFE